METVIFTCTFEGHIEKASDPFRFVSIFSEALLSYSVYFCVYMDVTIEQGSSKSQLKSITRVTHGGITSNGTQMQFHTEGGTVTVNDCKIVDVEGDMGTAVKETYRDGCRKVQVYENVLGIWDGTPLEDTPSYKIRTVRELPDNVKNDHTYSETISYVNNDMATKLVHYKPNGEVVTLLNESKPQDSVPLDEVTVVSNNEREISGPCINIGYMEHYSGFPDMKFEGLDGVEDIRGGTFEGVGDDVGKVILEREPSSFHSNLTSAKSVTTFENVFGLCIEKNTSGRRDTYSLQVNYLYMDEGEIKKHYTVPLTSDLEQVTYIEPHTGTTVFNSLKETYERQKDRDVPEVLTIET